MKRVIIPPFDFDNKNLKSRTLQCHQVLLVLVVLSAQENENHFHTEHAFDLQSFNHTHNYVGVVMGVASTPSM